MKIEDQEKTTYENFAFISYNREDEKYAKWLQKRLESYKVPTSVRKSHPSLPQKIRPIFRDQTDLTGGGSLSKEIEQGLANSRYLIVICSPRSARSPWVAKEVQSFIDRGRIDNIIPFIIEGKPYASNPEEECFPPSLRQLRDDQEILGININEMGREAAAIKVVSRMLGLKFDTLWQRHEKARRRKRLMGVLYLMSVLVISWAIAGYIINQNLELENANEVITKERDRANSERDRANSERDRANREKDRAEENNKLLLAANDSIRNQQKALDTANSNLKKTNAELQQTNTALVEHQQLLLDAYNNLAKEQANSRASDIHQWIASGNVATARIIARRFKPQSNSLLPITPDVEMSLRKLHAAINNSNFTPYLDTEIDYDELIDFDEENLYLTSSSNIAKLNIDYGVVIEAYPISNHPFNLKNIIDGDENGRYVFVNDTIVLRNKFINNEWAIEQIDSQTKQSIFVSPVKYKSLEPKFVIADTEGGDINIYYKSNEDELVCRNFFTGSYRWKRKFPYPIGDHFVKLRNKPGFAITNLLTKNIEFWHVDIKSEPLYVTPIENAYDAKLYITEGPSILALYPNSNGKTQLKLWRSHLNKKYKDTYYSLFYDKEQNRYERLVNQLITISSCDDTTSIMPVGNLENLRIIRSHHNSLISLAKVDDEERIIFSHINNNTVSTVIPSLTTETEYNYDWIPSYESKYFLENGAVGLGRYIPSSRLTQNTDLTDDGRYFATVLFGNHVFIYDYVNDQIYDRKIDDYINSIRFIQSEEKILLHCSHGSYVCDLQLNNLNKYPLSKNSFYPVYSVTDKKIIASAYLNGVISIIDVPTSTELKSTNIGSLVKDMSFNKFGDYLAVATTDNSILIYKIPSLEEIQILESSSEIVKIDFSESGDELIIMTEDFVYLINFPQLKELIEEI